MFLVPTKYQIIESLGGTEAKLKIQFQGQKLQKQNLVIRITFSFGIGHIGDLNMCISSIIDI